MKITIIGGKDVGGGKLAARSPDLTKCSFFLCGYVKANCYREPATTALDMRNRIRQAFTSITSAMLRDISRTFEEQLQICLYRNGNIFQHLQ